MKFKIGNGGRQNNAALNHLLETIMAMMSLIDGKMADAIDGGSFYVIRYAITPLNKKNNHEIAVGSLCQKRTVSSETLTLAVSQ